MTCPVHQLARQLLRFYIFWIVNLRLPLAGQDGATGSDVLRWSPPLERKKITDKIEAAKQTYLHIHQHFSNVTINSHNSQLMLTWDCVHLLQTDALQC
uniref:Uncharacterized protein n=1 Tax=Timema poppense TaxID=170557 RepID=A0A7R9CTP6_TIMPO|nr:unnamed protein product [Timema poppensis]